MTDDEIAALLRSSDPIVLVEAPAGCGKTYQAAEYARDAVTILGFKRVLVLTHTHAACSVVARATRQISRHVVIRTLDALIFEIAKAYRISFRLPEDIGTHIRNTKGDAWADLAKRVAALLGSNPMVCLLYTSDAADE